VAGDLLYLPAAGHRVMPWANGGGSTAEVAIFPPGASVSARDFDWRISMARVEGDGPFSALPGFDRILTLMAGPGITLEAAGQGRFVLDRAYAKAEFPGDWAIAARLHGGPIDDLNVMTRRGRWLASIDILPVDGQVRIERRAVLILVGLEGAVSVEGRPLGPRDALLAPEGGEGWLSLAGNGILAAVTLVRVAADAPSRALFTHV